MCRMPSRISRTTARTLQVYPIDTGRLRKVVELVAEKSGWGRKLPPRHGLGIAVHRSFVTYVAAVVEAAVDEKGNLSIPRVDVAVDCGHYVNPDRIRSQIEGAVIMGIGLAMKTQITFKDGKVMQSNFDDYEVTRMPEMPGVTNVHITPANYALPPGGNRRAGRAADRAGTDQCDLCGDRKADQNLADWTAIDILTHCWAKRAPVRTQRPAFN